MSLTIGIYFAIAMAVAISSLIGLVVQMQKENEGFVKELQFFLKHRTISHNKAKAQLAVLQSKFDKLHADFEALKTEAIKQDINFSGILEGAEFVEQQKKDANQETELYSLESPY